MNEIEEQSNLVEEQNNLVEEQSELIKKSKEGEERSSRAATFVLTFLSSEIGYGFF